MGFDVVHIVDDDQLYQPGTLKSNVDTLMGLKSHLGLSGLVGARHVVETKPHRSPASWVASMAFEPWQEAPKFCIGGCMCGFAVDFPTLPDDATGIADDAYACNFYFVKHFDTFKATGLMPIVFPSESRITFRTAQNWREYNHQQVRIRYGVLAAYAAFPDHQDTLRKYFCWRFHCDTTLDPRANVFGDMIEYLRWRIFRNLRIRANQAAERRISAGKVGVSWSTAQSTKPNFSFSRAKSGSND